MEEEEKKVNEKCERRKKNFPIYISDFHFATQIFSSLRFSSLWKINICRARIYFDFWHHIWIHFKVWRIYFRITLNREDRSNFFFFSIECHSVSISHKDSWFHFQSKLSIRLKRYMYTKRYSRKTLNREKRKVNTYGAGLQILFKWDLVDTVK